MTPEFRAVLSTTGSEPVSVVEGRIQLRVGEDNDAYDTEITALIQDARDRVETLTHRYWRRVVVGLGYPCFPASNYPLYIPVPDLVSLDSITYWDTDQNEQTLSGATLDTKRQLIKYTDGWPIGSQVLIELTAGPDNDSSPADVIPGGVKRGILMYLTDYFENRGAQVPYQLIDNQAANAAVHPHRVALGV